MYLFNVEPLVVITFLPRSIQAQKGLLASKRTPDSCNTQPLLYFVRLLGCARDV